MRMVSRFEANLLRVLHAILRQAPVEQVLPLLLSPLPRPKCLSANAMTLIKDTLAKGTVHILARSGWPRGRFLRDGRIVEGFLWQRTAPPELGLRFSPHALEFLLQLLSGTLGASVPEVGHLSLGDRFLFFLTFDALKDTALEEMLRTRWLPLQGDGLCRLAFLEAFSQADQAGGIDWETWTAGEGSVILESLQSDLAARWSRLERWKESPRSVASIRAVGVAQDVVYGEYLDALQAVERPDLARCFLQTAKDLLQNQAAARQWIGGLDVRNLRAAERQAIYLQALAFVRQVDRLKQWHTRAVAVGYFDEGYPQSQLWKADWERYDGDRLWERARAILHEVDPMS